MTLLPLIAAAYTFTATATGLDEGAPVEFFFAGEGTDRDYETLFVVKEGVGEICRQMEKAGIPAGKAVDLTKCVVWPVGCPVRLTPGIEDFLEISLPEGFERASIIYTGGLRDLSGAVIASTNMPMSLFALYSMPESPMVFNGIFDQGTVYNSFRTKKKFKKGDKVSFTLTWDEKEMPRSVAFTVKPGKGADLIGELKKLAAVSEIDVMVNFDPEMTVEEAQRVSLALSTVDSRPVKINGRVNDTLFFRAFLPLEKWRDRRERLVQPFELTLSDNGDELFYIEENWKVEGIDPKLTPKKITFDEAKNYKRTNTCFIYVDKGTKISRIEEAMKKFTGLKILNWYVFQK